MRILCYTGRHKPVESERWNDGFYFSRCARCEAPLIRPLIGDWKRVPRGQKVVWKPRTDADIDWIAWEREQEQENSAHPR